MRVRSADIAAVRATLSRQNATGEALQRAIESGTPLSPALLAQVQAELDRAADVPPTNLKSLLPGRLVFHPTLDNAAFAFFKQYVVPNSVEIIAHANGHTSVRVGPTWFDFRGRAPDFKVMDKNAENVSDVRRLKSVMALHKNPDAKGMEPAQLGMSVMYFLPRRQLHEVWKAFQAKPDVVPWDGTGRHGDSCISLSTTVLQEHAPELGVERSLGAEFFVDALQAGSKAALVACYTPDALSPFEFIASLIARKKTGDARFRELLGFVPPRLQPALEAARAGRDGVMPVFDGHVEPLVPPHGKVRLALEGSLFALRIHTLRQRRERE